MNNNVDEIGEDDTIEVVGKVNENMSIQEMSYTLFPPIRVMHGRTQVEEEFSMNFLKNNLLKYRFGSL